MKKSTAWIAAFAVVLCAATGAAATVTPSSELIVNGDFEAGDKNTGNYTPVQATDKVATSSYFPGWSLWNVLKARGGKYFVPSSADIGTYALVTKTESNRNNAGFHQDIVVTEPGTYKVSFTYAGRHGDSDGTDHGAQTIQVFLAPFDGDTAPGDTAEAKLVPDFNNNQLTAQYFESYKDLVPGKYRFKINTYATADRSTWFDRVSVRRIENVLVNGYFDETAVSGEYIYSHNADFSCPGWNFSTTSGLAVKNGTFLGNLPTGRTVMFVQSTSDVNTSSVYQDVTIDKPGIYTLSFRHVARPSNKNTFLNQNVKVLFGRIAEEKTDLADATDLVDSFTSTQSSSWEESKLRVAALVPGTYRLKITGSSTSDKCTVFDNFRLWLDDEIVVNGEFEEGSSGQESWGAYMSYDKCRNPGWSASQNNQVGIGNPFGTWVAAGLDVGKYMMYIQNSGGNNNVKAWQDVHVAVPGRYTLRHNYTGRPGCTGQSLTTQMGAVLDDDIDGSRVAFSETWTVSDATALAAFEKKNFEVPEAGEYRVRFIGKNSMGGKQDIATAIDCVSLKREPNYVYWTGGGDGETISNPANWGVESISYADDFVFTNDAPLTVNLTADFAAASVNFLGTGSVTLNGIVDDGETVATNTLSVAQIYSAPSAAAAIFNCPVKFTDGYDVVSTATNAFALGATATGWTYAQGAGAQVLDGDFTFTGDTLVLDGNVTVAAGRTLRAAGLTGVDDATLTIGDNAKAVLSGDIATFSGATPLLVVRLAETAELWATNSTAVASRHFFTGTRTKGTANVGGVLLNTANYDTGLYIGRINIGSDGVTHNGSAKGVYMDVANNPSASAEMTFGAFADWTWAPGGNGKFILYKNVFTFDTLDCFDGETPHTITLAALTIDDKNERSVIRKINQGTLVLAASNYFRGGLQVEGGVVRVAADQGSGVSPATVSSGATLEVVSGGVLRNSSVTVADGGTLALGDGGTLVSPVSAEGEVRVSGAATITAGGSIAITGGGTLAFDEGAKIIVGSDVAAGATLVTGAGLTAQDLAAHFETPYGAISLDGSGNVVYSSAIEWVTGGVWAEDDIYFGYANALNGGYVSNVLAAATVAGTGISRYGEASTASAAVLVDGNVHMPSGYPDYNIIYGIQQGTFTYTFASPTNIAEIAIFSRWGNGGRDGMRISDVLVQHEGSDEWQSAVPGELSIGIGSGDDHSSPGAMVAVLRRKDGLDLATGVTGVRLVFPSGQDNNGSGFTEFAAFDRVVSANSWTWNGNAGNTLFSDAGNWQDSSGNAAGAADDVFAPAARDTLSIPASTQVTVDTAVDVAVVRLGGGVTLANPAADAGTGAVATNTITCSAIVNAGGESVIDCAVRFIDPYNVAATDVVRFAGGATAARMGKLSAGPSRVLAGDITIAADFDVIDASADYWCVTNASRLTAGVLKKNDASGNVNGTPNFRICEGGYAHFTSINSGRDRITVSVQGELEVDDWYDTKSVKNNKNETFGCDIGYSGDEAFAGSTIRAGGIHRTRYSTSSGLTDWTVRCYPANYYIGSLGIGLTYRDYTLMFTGCEKHIYATADFSIFNYTDATPDNPADWGVYIAADTTLDTQGHTVTWTAGAVINLSSTFTKAGEGTLVMQPRGATYEGAGNAVVVAGGTLEARACTLSGAATWSSVFGGVPVTVKDGAVLRIAPGVTSVTNAVTLEEGATLDIQSFTSRSAEAASVGALSAAGPATVRLSGTLPDSVFSTGTNFVIAASCDAATLANISLDKTGLLYENEKPCTNSKLKVIDGKLALCVVPYFYMRIADNESSELAIPKDWIFENSIATDSDSEETVVAALKEDGANGIPVWQSYCLGLNPSDSSSVVLCRAAPDQPVSPNEFKFTIANISIPENLSGVVLTAYLERKTSGDNWVTQSSTLIPSSGEVELVASADSESTLSFFA